MNAQGNGDPPPLKAAIYARYSSEGQRASSIEDQVRLCRQEAERRGWAVVATWKDEATSGALGEDQRPGFREMMAAASRRAFDVLLVDDSSRLSRDSADATVTLRMLDFLGVKFVARSDGIDTAANSKSSRLLYGIKAAMNEEFLRDLGEKTHRGQEGRVRAGLSAGGLPYGYRSEPVTDDRGRVIGYRRLIYEPEAKIVRRIFEMYGDARSGREIADALNREGIAPPGARWQGRTVRQATSWSYTAIVGHRRMKKGILNNPMYIGQVLWNRSRWLRHPVTKHYTYRMNTPEDWIQVEAPELNIVPQELWDRAQARMAALHVGGLPIGGKQRRYLLSGFVRCGVCGGHYIISTPFSYRCGTFRNRGASACPNHLAISRRRLERVVIPGLKQHLYTDANVAAVVARVRQLLQERAGRPAADARPEDRAKALRRVEREIEHIGNAIRQGIITPTTKTMLEDAERRRVALLHERGEHLPADGIPQRLAQVLKRLPELVGSRLDDLETLLGTQQIEKGKQILAALETTVTLHPCGDHLEAEISGTVPGLLLLAAQNGPNTRPVQLMWLGEEDSNPR